uniref:Uncharacterized protein n=1 Tax=Knipowitschia caucasica TaxID=637954 RepID=A0AAV2IR84_KNICA
MHRERALSAPSRDCLIELPSRISGNEPRDGDGGCNIRAIIVSGPIAALRSRCSLPCAGERRRARGNLCHREWEGGVESVVELRYKSQSRAGNLKQDSGSISAPQPDGQRQSHSKPLWFSFGHSSE